VIQQRSANDHSLLANPPGLHLAIRSHMLKDFEVNFKATNIKSPARVIGRTCPNTFCMSQPRKRLPVLENVRLIANSSCLLCATFYAYRCRQDIVVAGRKMAHFSDAWGYRGGSPTAVQAWRPCTLWEPSLVTLYYCILGDLLFFVICVRLLYFSVTCVSFVVP